MISKTTTSVWQKVALVLFGLVLSLAILEMGMHVGGFALLAIQDHANWRALKRKNTCRILCLGESTTHEQYPQPLERILNERNAGMRFSVIDKGRPALNSTDILAMVETDLDAYHPHAVVAMMGINDRIVKYYEAIPEVRSWIFQHCRVYRLARVLYVNFFKKGVLNSAGTGADRAPDVPGVDLSDRATFLKMPRGTIEDHASRQDEEGDVELGRSFMEHGEYQKANDFFEKALALDPRNVSAYDHLGELRKRQDSIPEAKRLLETAIALSPGDDNLYVALGNLYPNWRADFSKKEELFRKALALNPHNGDAYEALGRLYLRVKNDFPQAERLLAEAMKFSPENAYIPLTLGGHYRLRGDLTRAEALFKRAVQIAPQNERALEALASLYEMLGKSELAREYAGRMRASNLEDYAPVTIRNYQRLRAILDRRGIKLFCVQYPMRSVEPLRRIFGKDRDVFFVDNEQAFQQAVKKDGYAEYFRDMFAGDFGHCTQRGNELLAQNIAEVILKWVMRQ